MSCYRERGKKVKGFASTCHQYSLVPYRNKIDLKWQRVDSPISSLRNQQYQPVTIIDPHQHENYQLTHAISKQKKQQNYESSNQYGKYNNVLKSKKEKSNIKENPIHSKQDSSSMTNQNETDTINKKDYLNLQKFEKQKGNMDAIMDYELSRMIGLEQSRISRKSVIGKQKNEQTMKFGYNYNYFQPNKEQRTKDFNQKLLQMYAYDEQVEKRKIAQSKLA